MTMMRTAGLTAVAALIAAASVTPTARAGSNDSAGDVRARAARAASALVASHAANLHIGEEDAFIPHPVISYLNGLQYVPYERTYRGLPVIGGGFVVITNSTGQVLDTSITQPSTISLATVTPKIARAQAERIASSQLSTVEKIWDTELVVFAIGEPTLAWQTRMAGRTGDRPRTLTIVVDAGTGGILNRQELIAHGTGTSAWNGPNPVPLDTTQSGGAFLLREPAHPTVECQDSLNNTTFKGADDLWGDGNATHRETGCVDALFAAETEERMLTQWLGRNSFNGTGGGWPIRVGLHATDSFFDGMQIQIGHNAANQWLTSLDMVAHELGHGVDQTTGTTISPVAGETSEFIADAFGASTEWFANEPFQFDPPDFLVGEEVNVGGAGPIRNMFNPSELGDPNCWSSMVGGLPPHMAAGVGNHWFYLLAEGTHPNGQPPSPTCNGSTITGLGVQTALQIIYGGMLQKTTSQPTYRQYRAWTLVAAKNLFPGDCAPFNTVKAAWNAVSVPPTPADPTCTPS
jgi:Zn-dependent metalloprotease